jgi:glycosyltransferase involved in cell wall biosynthesis
LIHASLREGWGLNVIEANAMGTPAVVYPVGGLVDSTLHGETGTVTPEETPASLAAGVVALLNRPAEYDRLRVNAWERSKTFAWRNVLPPACDWLEQQARRRSTF